jgi:uncharacterized protein
MNYMKTLNEVSWWLVIVGALNWGLVAVNPTWNVVSMLLGAWPSVEMLVYALVGLSALYQLALKYGLVKK